MPFTKSFVMSIAALLFIGTNIATALPALESEQFLPNLAVLIREDDYSYNHSETMTAAIRSNAMSFGLAKRANAKVQACSTTSCTDCRTVWDGSFSSNSACIPADNTACLIISNLDDANVQFWNHAGCNGKNTVFRGCSDGAQQRSAPGTNSLGVHTGC
ncbi:hypothetical protein EG329_011160 [Mollisiaceae sp. DMI_Dod_QoI]|nr:hypothetical protein EG329_011160 [Helotiales sp. DMI_Dod_QoI]